MRWQSSRKALPSKVRLSLRVVRSSSFTPDAPQGRRCAAPSSPASPHRPGLRPTGCRGGHADKGFDFLEIAHLILLVKNHLILLWLLFSLVIE
jgi:hypothetical protein